MTTETPNPRDAETADQRIHCRSEIVEYVDRPDECTLYPWSTDCRDELLSTWITAAGDGFVDAREMR